MQLTIVFYYVEVMFRSLFRLVSGCAISFGVVCMAKYQVSRWGQKEYGNVNFQSSWVEIYMFALLIAVILIL